MTILFGTVEYFEREILSTPDDLSKSLSKDEYLKSIYAKLENEVLFNFVCDEKIRIECLQNLQIAYERLNRN